MILFLSLLVLGLILPGCYCCTSCTITEETFAPDWTKRWDATGTWTETTLRYGGFDLAALQSSGGRLLSKRKTPDGYQNLSCYFLKSGDTKVRMYFADVGDHETYVEIRFSDPPPTTGDDSTEGYISIVQNGTELSRLNDRNGHYSNSMRSTTPDGFYTVCVSPAGDYVQVIGTGQVNQPAPVVTALLDVPLTSCTAGVEVVSGTCKVAFLDLYKTKGKDRGGECEPCTNQCPTFCKDDETAPTYFKLDFFGIADVNAGVCGITCGCDALNGTFYCSSYLHDFNGVYECLWTHEYHYSACNYTPALAFRANGYVGAGWSTFNPILAGISWQMTADDWNSSTNANGECAHVENVSIPYLNGITANTDTDLVTHCGYCAGGTVVVSTAWLES